MANEAKTIPRPLELFAQFKEFAPPRAQMTTSIDIWAE